MLRREFMTDKIAPLSGALGPLSEPLSTRPADALADTAAVDRAAPMDHLAGPPEISSGPAPTDPLGPLDDIVAALEAQRIDPHAAIELIVDRSLAEFDPTLLSASERVAAREQVLARVASDPHLAGLRARLGSTPAFETGGPNKY